MKYSLMTMWIDNLNVLILQKFFLNDWFDSYWLTVIEEQEKQKTKKKLKNSYVVTMGIFRSERLDERGLHDMTRAQNKLGSGRRGRRPADSDGLTPLRPSPAHTPLTPEPTYSLVPAFLITFTRHFHSNDIITLRNLYPTQLSAFNIIHN